MNFTTSLLVALVALAFGWSAETNAGKRTVCTITVNSTDEKEMFKQRLPASQYQFVELVERGRPDWLESACKQGVRCDLLIISGHFDGITEFYSDQLAASEFLPVAEMERVSCSESCPGLFSQLKEVYLFGCDTLNAGAVKSASAEVGRSLMRAGHSPADARRLTETLNQLHGESSRDRMRRIFTNVPVIYGFSSVAPLGPHAATLLGRYLQPSALSEVGSGRVSSRLLGHFCSRVVDLGQRVRRTRTRAPRIGATCANSSTIASRPPTSSSSSTGFCAATWRKCACSSSASRGCLRR